MPLMAAVMLAAGSAATVVVMKKENTQFWQPKTEALGHLGEIKSAIAAYQQAYHRLPCVASRTAVSGNSDYGTEIANCDGGAAATGGTLRVDLGGGVYLRVGALPHMTLKVGGTSGEDKWGSRYTYAVIESLTNTFKFTTGSGSLIIQDNSGAPIMANAAWVVVSHGADQRGAYGAKNTSGAVIKACGISGTGKDFQNCNGPDNTYREADMNTIAGADFFDDMISYAPVDAYAQTINKPCVRATIGAAAWSPVCTDATWSDLANGASETLVNENAAAVGGAAITCNNGALAYSGQSCNRHCTAQTPHNWSAHSCSANIPQLNHGVVSAVINNVAAGRTGTTQATCTDGTLTYTESCTPAGCTRPWGGAMNHGDMVTAFQTTSVACGSTCTSEARTCSYGTLSGSYVNQNCTVANCGCTLPWGGSINHGDTVTAYTSSSVACGGNCSTVAQSRTCNNGTLTNAGNFGSCSVSACAGCASPCGAISHGGTCTAYSATSVACGANCSTVAQTRTCSNGTLSGSFTNASCSPAACANCASPCGTIAHNATCTAYTSATVPCGQTCATVQQSRLCTNGSLSGSATNASCSVDSCGPPSPAPGCNNVDYTTVPGATTPAQTCNSYCGGLGWDSASWNTAPPWVQCCCSAPAFDPCDSAGYGTGCMISGSMYGGGCIGADVHGDGTVCCAGCSGGSGAGSSCFLGDVKITMADGTEKKISDVKVGDKVKGITRVNTVQRLTKYINDEPMYGINEREGFVTAEHPFFGADGKLYSVNPKLTYTETKGTMVTEQLKEGVVIQTLKGEATVKSISIKPMEPRPVYNLVLDGDHSYYADGFAVHNETMHKH